MTSVGIMASSAVVAAGVDVLLEPFNNLSAWTTNGATPATIVAGRTGTAANQSGSSSTHWIHHVLGADESADVTIGFAYRPTTLTARNFAGLWSDSNVTEHIRLVLTATGAIEVRTGASLLATSAAGLVAAATWVYLELQVKLGDAGIGSYELRVNGATVLGPTGADTKNAGTKTVYDTIRLTGATSAGTVNQFDDLYVTVGAGAVFKGAITIP